MIFQDLGISRCITYLSTIKEEKASFLAVLLFLTKLSLFLNCPNASEQPDQNTYQFIWGLGHILGYCYHCQLVRNVPKSLKRYFALNCYSHQ